MKQLYAIIFIIMTLVLGACVIITFASKKPIARYLRYPIIFALLPTIANFTLMICSTPAESNMAYSIFYGSINWLLLTLLRYCINYTGLKPRPKFIPWVLLVLTAADSVSMLINPILGHAYNCVEVAGANGEIYYITKHLLWFNVHLVFSYILSILCFVVLIYKLCTSATVYWKKYIATLVSLAVTIVWDLFFVNNTNEIDKSIIGFGISACLVTYFTLINKQHTVIYDLLNEVVCNSSDMILFFNTDHECIFANDPAKFFFNLTDDTLDKSKDPLREILKDDFFPANTNSYRKIFTTMHRENKTHLRIEYKVIEKHNRTEGCFYHIQNCTDDINQMESEKYKATHSDLTGLFNKATLIELTETLLREHPEQQYYIVAFDIKNFKLLNDLFGRDVGDRVLIQLAEILNNPSIPNEILGQISGDRFVQVVREENIEQNLAQFEKIFEQTPDILKDQNYSIVVHAGVYKVSKSDTSVVTMFDRAFLALSSVKDRYENRYAFYDDNMRKALVWEQQITAALDTALEDGQFEVYLQPQTDSECRIVGAEALVRWNHPEKGLIPPSQFIKTLEKNGMISRLDYFMWENACMLLAKWKRNGREDFYISVNLSPLDFYYMDVYSTFVELTKKYDVSPTKIHIEMTETAMMSDLEIKLPVIERLRLAGFVIAMDDFGSGYSSLNLLKDLPVDVLKIDMAFLYHAKNASKSRTIIQQVIELGKKLGLSVVTEGVETEAQLEFLKTIGCDSYQGYHFEHPIPIYAFEEKYFQ